MSMGCVRGANLKCCGCGGEHAVTFGGCELMKEEVAVQKVKVLGSSDLCRSSEGKTEARY